MPQIDPSSLSPSDNFLISLGQNVWLMDDHRWALLVWEQEKKHRKYSLVHADSHWDACYDFWENPDAENELILADLTRIKEYLIEDKYIRYDSFIAPAVRRGLFDVVHFFCKECDTNDIGFYDEFLKTTETLQVVHETAESLAAVTFLNPIIFDLCLDLFNDSDQWMEGDLWDDETIEKFLDSIKHIISAADIVTVSLSFNYSGSHDDTRSLASLVIPKLMSYRNDA